jgi:hypothetical protein
MKQKMYLMIAVVVAVGLAMVGSQLAYATNEDDYKVGIELGKRDWNTCQTPDGDCENANESCSVGGSISQINGVVHIGPPPSNQTACKDGWLRGFHN